jgi:hypothetical protein
MDLTERLLASGPTGDPDGRWAASGAMAITGRADGPPLLVAASVAPSLDRLADRLAGLSGRLGASVGLDGPALLGERAALSGLTRQGATSAGGVTRLLRAADGWVALCLARPADRGALAAWLDDGPVDADDAWPAVTAAVLGRAADELVARAVLLGLPCARLGETVPGPLAVADGVADAPATASLAGVVVADLTSLWAGPLCADLLGRAGATVVKIESVQRPDGARLGNPAFFELMNAGKQAAVVDLATAAGRRELADLLAGADVVLEAARPRALEQLGIDARHVLATGRPRVWCSITGHGRSDEAAHRIGFGDDAAVAGGLVAWDDDGPCFVADAAADPATGLVAAVAVLDRLAVGGRWLVDVALARTAAHLAAGPVTAGPWTGAVAAPQARQPRAPT